MHSTSVLAIIEQYERLKTKGYSMEADDMVRPKNSFTLSGISLVFLKLSCKSN